MDFRTPKLNGDARCPPRKPVRVSAGHDRQTKRRELSMKLGKKWVGISALAIGSLAAAATSAGAFGGPGRPGGRFAGGGPNIAVLEHRLERLDLSADVRAKAFAIVDASRTEDR